MVAHHRRQRDAVDGVDGEGKERFVEVEERLAHGRVSAGNVLCDDAPRAAVLFETLEERVALLVAPTRTEGGRGGVRRGALSPLLRRS